MKYYIVTLLVFICSMGCMYGQNLKFHISSFGEDSFDMTARSEQYKKVDGSGSLYAIIKVKSETPNDNIGAYQYNFGMMQHEVQNHEGDVWVYVQKNAKTVTIRREGYQTISQYDLGLTIEAGKTYKMILSAQGPVVYTQMLMFKVSPAASKAVVTIKGSESGAVDQMLGNVDASGAIAKNLPFGTYTYRILSENYYPTEGRITLNDKSQTYIENVSLRPRFSVITLNVASDAEIYVNGERKGQRTWSGQLNAGVYQVECRQQNHRSSSQSITVEENKPQTITLAAPTPITGTLSILSNPLGANIKIDGKDYGTTPRNIDVLLIGQHEVTLSLNGYDETKATVNVKENETAELNVALSDVGASLKKANDYFDKKEYSLAIEIYQRLANQGNAEAQRNLGICYEEGIGVDKDLKKAVELYEKAANQGNAKAQNNLGICYEEGIGVDKDLKKAVELYEKAANQGNAIAQYNLGLCYEYGIGVPKDTQKAAYWKKKYEENSNK